MFEKKEISYFRPLKSSTHNCYFLFLLWNIMKIRKIVAITAKNWTNFSHLFQNFNSIFTRNKPKVPCLRKRIQTL